MRIETTLLYLPERGVIGSMGGGWLVMNGYHVDLILRDIKRVEQIIKDTEQGIVTANYQTGHPHGYISAMYRGELAISKIQYAKNESL